MTDAPTIEAFTIDPQLLPYMHQFLAKTRIPPAHLIVAVSAIVAVALDLDEDARIVWAERVIEEGFIDPAVMGEARENMKDVLNEMKGNVSH